MSSPMPTSTRLKKLFRYDSETGLFTRIQAVGYTKAGEVAGSLDAKGYRVIVVDGKPFKAHRLAWLYMTGEQPPALVDHVNRTPDDNRWANLRAATKTQNRANSKANRTNTSGYRGVHFHKGCQKWRALIRLGKRRVSLGLFGSAQEAAEVYDLASVMIHGEYANV